MLQTFLKLLEPARFKEQLTDEAEIKRQYNYWRIRIFYSMYIGYVFFYFTRKTFTFSMTAMQADLGLSYAELGFISTLLYITYGISKFTSGVLSDRSNPRYFMAFGLILTGVFNITFGLSSSIYLFWIFWALNGWFQGWGWPPITKLLTHWYSKKERGTWWSVCSTSHNVGGAIIPIVVAFYISHLNWRFAMLIPGLMCIVVGLFLLNRLRDVPQSLGLPSIEKFKNEGLTNSEDINANTTEAIVLSPKEILFDHVLNNKFVWVMAISYFFVYVVRTAINDWSAPYLENVKGYDRLLANSSIMWFEVGGFFGMLISGWGSDYFFRGKRAPFILFCAVGMALSLSAFWYAPAGNIVLEYILITLIGFFVFGPQMLVGLAAAEYVDKKAACTANGFVGCWAYIGAAATGYPLGLIIDNSWDLYYKILIICSMLTFIVLLPLAFKPKVIFSQLGTVPK